MSANRKNRLFAFFCALLLVLLSGCEQLDGLFKQPDISVTQIRLLPGYSLEQSIEVSIKLYNPNSYPLPLNRIKYAIDVNERTLVSGETTSVSSVEAGGKTSFVVTAKVSLLESVDWIDELFQGRPDNVHYKIRATIGTGLIYPPTVQLEREGKVAFYK